MLFVYTKQGGAVKYEKNSGGTLDFQRTPDAMRLASVAGKGGLRNTFPFKISLTQIPLQAHFAEHEASQSQASHTFEGWKVRCDKWRIWHWFFNSLNVVFNCLNYGQQDKAHSKKSSASQKPKEKHCSPSTWSSSTLEQSSQLQCPTSQPCPWANKN